MPTILLKRSNTPGAVPGTANLTNLAGGAELAVNTADRRLFTMNSSSAVVEVGTNPSSLTCADASFTVARIGSLTVSSLSLTNATITSATVTTLTATSANVTTLTGTTLGTFTSGTVTNLNSTSANIETLTGTTFGTTAATQLRGASAQITTATVTSANITTLTGTSMNVTTATHASANITTLSGTTATYTSATVTNLNSTSANITTLTGTNFSATSLTLTNALRIAEGGTGLDSTPTNGQLLIGNGTGFTLSTLTAGTNISVTNGTGSISIASTVSTGDITFSSGTISTANTNQNLLIDPNGSGRTTVNTGPAFSAYGTSVEFTVNGNASGNLYPMLVQTVSYPRSCLTLWNNDSGRGSNNAQFVNFVLDPAETSVGVIRYNNSSGLLDYLTSSDYRLKDIYGPVTDSGSKIDLLKVYRGKMKNATTEMPMMVAHEVQAVTPYVVSGTKDEVDEQGKPVYQQVDYTKLIPLFLAEIQSLRARVAALETN